MRCSSQIIWPLFAVWILLVGAFGQAPAHAVPNAPTIVQIEGKTVVGGQTLYLNQTTALTVIGNAEADKTIKIRNGGTQIATTTANGAGAYTVDITLSAGTHTSAPSPTTSPATAAPALPPPS